MIHAWFSDSLSIILSKNRFYGILNMEKSSKHIYKTNRTKQKWSNKTSKTKPTKQIKQNKLEQTKIKLNETSKNKDSKLATNKINEN